MVMSFGLSGIDGFVVRVEVNLSSGLPAFELVGLPDAAVKESKERVRAALKNSGQNYPTERLTVNLAPADVKKEGPIFDLPIAVGIVASGGRIKKDALGDTALFGELSLDGSVRPVRGALPMAIAAMKNGVKRLIFPGENAGELMCLNGIELYPAASLRQVVGFLKGDERIAPLQTVAFEKLIGERSTRFDFRFVKGQQSAKRALEIAAAGGHNVLMIGAPGSGKTLLARCVPSILPELTFEEALEVTRIHSVAGAAAETGLVTERPFRSPHHTASSASLAGGGANALPGELSKAHHGVLFLDELPEYKRDALEALRQPMEDGFVSITRVASQSTYPSSFMLICSMNPCPCGLYGAKTGECRCSANEIRRYLGRISGPLLDRIDIHIEVDSIPADRLADMEEEEPSAAVRERVEAAREVQRRRYAGKKIPCNARLDARTLNAHCPMESAARELLKAASESMGLSNRAYTRIQKVARTIADLEKMDVITAAHVAEAVQYRTLDRKYWG